MSRRRSLLVLGPVLLLAAACQTVVTPDRVLEGGGEMVTVSSEPFIIPINACPPQSEVEVFIDDATEPAGTGTTDGDGQFSVEIAAPSDPGAYEVYATCLQPGDPPTELDLAPITLIVEPALQMTADPTELAPGQELDVTGTWCVSQDDDGEVPTAEVSFEGVTEPHTAASSQPFGESWTSTFTAPAEPGTYEVTATCTYDEVDPDVPFDIPDLPGFPGLPDIPELSELSAEEQRAAVAAASDVEPAAVDVDYEPVTVEVVVEAPVEPTPTPTPPAPRAPEAEPAQGVQPSFVG